ncbi:MAG TPA: VWA domain-containing protein [Candidatus Acidoferrum sp.]|jgi:hypothetical protein
MRWISLLLLALLGVMPTLGRRQAVPVLAAGKEEDTVRTVFVTVAETNGTPVSGLKREDFSLRANGAFQEIVETLPAGAMPIVVGILIDESGSMSVGNDRKEKLQTLSPFLSSVISKPDEAIIVGVSDDERHVTSFTNNIQELQQGVKAISDAEVHGSTLLYDSLLSLVQNMQQEQDRRRIIVVFGDFRDTMGDHKLKEIISHLQEMETSVFVLLDDLHWPHDLKGQKLGIEVGETGGAAYKIDSVHDMERALKQIQIAVRSSYLLKYRMRGRLKESAELNVTVQGKDVNVLAPQRSPSGIPSH